MNWTRDELKAILAKPDGYTSIKRADGSVGKAENRWLIYKFLQSLYERQTADEQAVQVTKYQNGIGFNSVDSSFLSSVAETSRKYKNLTAKQATWVARKLVKYTGQLEEIAASKLQQKLPVPPVENNCSYCGEGLPQCKCYWKAEHARLEREQEAAVYEREMMLEQLDRELRQFPRGQA